MTDKSSQPAAKRGKYHGKHRVGDNQRPTPAPQQATGGGSK